MANGKCMMHGGMLSRRDPVEHAEQMRRAQKLAHPAQHRNLEIRRYLKSQGIISAVGLPRRPAGMTTEDYRIEMAKRELERIRAEDAAGNMDSNGESHGERLERLTGLALDAQQRILEEPLPKRAGPRLALLKVQQTTADQILKLRVRTDEQALRRETLNRLPQFLRRLAAARLIEPDDTQ